MGLGGAGARSVLFRRGGCAVHMTPGSGSLSSSRGRHTVSPCDRGKPSLHWPARGSRGFIRFHPSFHILRAARGTATHALSGSFHLGGELICILRTSMLRLFIPTAAVGLGSPPDDGSLLGKALWGLDPGTLFTWWRGPSC